ncbi:MAG: hypothetical protein MK132_15100 [Lentisphaerales bacterium]|nr:hypothetical protein [Lentisphaerales bacterium]
MELEIVTINLSPDYCCGGGHCGPLPGYFYVCPHCNMDTQCRTGYALQVGEHLSCTFCKGKVKATKQLSEFKFEFEYDPAETDG